MFAKGARILFWLPNFIAVWAKCWLGAICIEGDQIRRNAKSGEVLVGGIADRARFWSGETMVGRHVGQTKCWLGEVPVGRGAGKPYNCDLTIGVRET